MIVPLFPHPVLLSNGTDYKQGKIFEMTVKGSPQHTIDGMIRIVINFELKSSFMDRLIADGKAKIMVVIKCTKTYERRVFPIHGNNETLDLPLAHYRGMIKLSPYISAMEDIESFKSTEHHEEFSGIKINVPAGAILARGSDSEITVDSLQKLSSAIRLLTNNKLERGKYDVDCSGDYIEIHMHDDTRKDVMNLRKTHRWALFPSLYMSALTHALQSIKAEPTLEWETGLKKTLDSKGIKIDDELKENAYKYSQDIFQYPLNQLTQQLHGGINEDD